MADLIPQYNAMTPNLATPQQRSEADITYPIYGPPELARKKKLYKMVPAHLNRTAKAIEVAWQPLLDQWEAHSLSFWVLRQQQSEHGSLHQKAALYKAQVEGACKMEEFGIPAPVASTLFVDENLKEIVQMAGEHIKDVELKNLTAKKSEVFWTKGVKILFVVPQLLVFCQAVRFDPTRSLVFGLFLLIAAFALTNVYQLIARPVIESLASLSGKPTEHYGNQPLHQWAVITHLILFTLGFVAVVLLAMFLDGTVFYTTSQLDLFGKKNPLAFNFPTALGIAGSFSGLLALASLVIAWQERNVAETLRMVEQKLEALTRHVAPAFKAIRAAEGECKEQENREAEINARFISGWGRLCTAIYLMTKNVSDAAIVRYLMLPHSPYEACKQPCRNE